MLGMRWYPGDADASTSMSLFSNKRRTSPSNAHLHSISYLFLLHILHGFTAVSALIPPPLPVRRHSFSFSCQAYDAIVKATASTVEQETDYTPFGIFNTELSSDSLNASAVNSPFLDQHTHNNRAGALTHTDKQLKSIQSNAPAVLLKSGPGTGKTYALASRIAYLIRSESCRPEQMVVLSFTNRDAHLLKERAINMYKQQCNTDTNNISRKEIMDRLWSGTIHAFASSIIKAYSRIRRKHFRVINSKEMRMRVDKCLRILLEEKYYGKRGGPSISKLKRIRILHRDALGEVRQSRGVLLHQMCRCYDLWKEAGILPPPAVAGIQKLPHNLGRKQVRDDCVELSMRLGISQNVAMLAIESYPQYQTLHEAHGTADPSDLAAIATHVLMSDARALVAFRTKLKHLILDEYQDVSVTQHSLIRIIVRGVVDETEECCFMQAETSLPVLARVHSSHIKDANVCFQVPRLFCGGDSNQSIYGWRGAAPYISTEGFLRDYPQGIIVPLDESFRLPRGVWDTANGLIDRNKNDKQTMKTRSTFTTKRPSQDLGDSDETLRALFAKVSYDDELSSPIRVQGLWDAREEAKFIASTIRKRYKARMKRCEAALEELRSSLGHSVQIGKDPLDVAVMVRSGKQLDLIKEALMSIGIPFVVCTGEEDVASLSRTPIRSNLKLVDMKPVVLMTMHRAKGEEFDDVYLAGWTEGSFPHPTSISANRVDEERRLAFVAITRARRQVVITHSFVDRLLHIGPNFSSKYVTTQVSPSRFLYELVPAAQISSADTVHNAGIVKRKSSHGLPCVVWYRGKGVKECVAGRDVPEYFAKSYEVESSYQPAQPLTMSTQDRSATITSLEAPFDDTKLSIDGTDDGYQRNGTESRRNDNLFNHLSPSDREMFDRVQAGLDDICRGNQRGTKGKWKTVFREALRERFGLERGNALVLPVDEASRIEGKDFSCDILLRFSHKRLKRKPLSRATALELGLFLCFRLLSPIDAKEP